MKAFNVILPMMFLASLTIHGMDNDARTDVPQDATRASMSNGTQRGVACCTVAGYQAFDDPFHPVTQFLINRFMEKNNIPQSILLQGHEDWVYVVALAVMPDGKLLCVSGSLDWTACVWDLETGECKKVLIGHEGTVFSVALAVTKDGKLLCVTGSCDRTVRVWDLETGKCKKILKDHGAAVKAVALAVTKDGKLLCVSGSLDCTVRVWDLETGECKKILQGHEGTVLSVALAVTKDGKLLCVSGSLDNTVRAWDLETGKCKKILKDHKTPGSVALAVSKDDKLQCVTGSYYKTGTVRVWDLGIPEALQGAIRQLSLAQQHLLMDIVDRQQNCTEEYLQRITIEQHNADGSETDTHDAYNNLPPVIRQLIEPYIHVADEQSIQPAPEPMQQKLEEPEPLQQNPAVATQSFPSDSSSTTNMDEDLPQIALLTPALMDDEEMTDAPTNDQRVLKIGLTTKYGCIVSILKTIGKHRQIYQGFLTNGSTSYRYILQAEQNDKGEIYCCKRHFSDGMDEDPIGLRLWYHDETDYFQVLKNAFETTNNPDLSQMLCQQAIQSVNKALAHDLQFAKPLIMSDGRKIDLAVKVNGDNLKGTLITDHPTEAARTLATFSLTDPEAQGFESPKIHGIAPWGNHLLALLTRSKDEFAHRVTLLRLLAIGEPDMPGAKSILESWQAFTVQGRPLIGIKGTQTPEAKLAIKHVVYNPSLKQLECAVTTLAGDLSKIEGQQSVSPDPEWLKLVSPLVNQQPSMASAATSAVL